MPNRLSALPRAQHSLHRFPRGPIGLYGLGAFGRFVLPYLCRFGPVRVHDPRGDAGAALPPGADRVGFAAAARCPIIVLAVPFTQLAPLGLAMAPHLVPGAVVFDTCSVKVRALAALRAALPGHADLVGTHPLFGPQSGRDGIAGQTIVICEGASRRSRAAVRLLARRLDVSIAAMSADAHDREMVHVQALTHMMARLVKAMDLPEIRHPTATYRHLMAMVALVGEDDDALFRTILHENPHGATLIGRLRAASRQVARQISGDDVGQDELFDFGDAVLERQLALLEPLHQHGVGDA